jgi:hypothetical protein
VKQKLRNYSISDVATNCQAFTCCRNVSYVVGLKRAGSTLFECIVTVLQVLKYSTACKRDDLPFSVCACYGEYRRRKGKLGISTKAYTSSDETCHGILN